MSVHLKQEVVLATTPDKVWALLQNFYCTEEWLPGVSVHKEKSVEGKQVRTMVTSDGKVKEKLEKKVEEEKERYLEWTITKTKLPISNFSAQLMVTRVGRSRCRVTFTCKFDSTNSEVMKSLFNSTYRDGLAKIKLPFEG